MKAYAVVRKPEPSTKTISHTFKLQKKNPEISIDPIQENRSLTPRKAESTLPEHLIRTSSKHFRVQESFTQLYVPSKSPARKHPIFNQMISQFMQTKMRKQSQSKMNSAKLNESINESNYEKRSINFSKVSEQKLENQNKLQKKQIFATPEKATHKNYQQTPYDLLNSSERDRQIRALSVNRRNRIFEQYRSTSKQRKVNYPQASQDKSNTFKRSLAHQLELLHQKSQMISNQKLINQRQTAHHIFADQRFSKNDHIIEKDFSCSEIDIGCCGEQLKQHQNTPKNEVVYHRTVNFPKRDNAIMNSLAPQFLAYSHQKSRSKSRRRIFNHINPELQKSNKQIQNYKQDKIKAKPVFTQPKSKQLKVVVYEINSYPPFEF